MTRGVPQNVGTRSPAVKARNRQPSPAGIACAAIALAPNIGGSAASSRAAC